MKRKYRSFPENSVRFLLKFNSFKEMKEFVSSKEFQKINADLANLTLLKNVKIQFETRPKL
nr:MAG: hypothetical protein [uncultured archaeon]